MTELLAPNGKPSNLTPEQYELVRTPAFKEWFGDWEKLILTKINDSGIDEISLKRLEDGVSKVVDSNGEPLPVYHGTNGDFYEFDINKQRIGWLGKGFYFSKNKREAKDYGKRLIKAFLKIENPFIVEGDVVLENGQVKWALNREGQVSEKYGEVDNTDISNTLKKYKNDGIIEGDMINCFYPNQIKLADGTNTTFDGNNPDIRFNDGGLVDKINDLRFYETPIDADYINSKSKKGHTLDNLPKNTQKIYINSNLFEKEKYAWGKVSNNKIAYHERPIDDKYWNKNIYKEPPVLIEYDEENNQLRVRDGNHRLNVYLNEKYKYIPIVLTKKALKFISKLADGSNTTFDSNNPDIRFETGGEIKLKLDEKYKKILNDENNYPFLILNENDEKIGQIDLMYREDLGGYQVYNASVKEKGKGIGKKAYIQLRKLLGKPIISDSSRTEDAENFWKSLEKNNLAFFDENILKYKMYKKGGRTIAQTPAPKKERIYGSEKNKPESSKDTKSAEKIEFNEKTLETIKNKVAEHNEKNPKKKVTLASAKAVVRRGMGAYSSSHRPTIKGGKPNSRVAWGLARLNAFFYKIINGKSKSGKYNQDDDLINELGYKVKKYSDGGQVEKMKNLFLQNGFTEDELQVIVEENPNYFNQIQFYDNETLIVYRALELPRKLADKFIKLNKKEIGEGIGEYWTFDKNLQNAIWGDGQYEEETYLIQCKGHLDISDIDWEMMKYAYDDDIYHFSQESEIRGINGGNSIKVVECEEVYSNGGDIQAYEEAIGISQFDEGGEAKPKKVYVSIRLANDYERISGNLHLFKKYKDESFQELKNQKLVGVRGVSLSKDNVADWFVNRDCLIVMKYDEFILINDTTEIKYDDPYQLMANDLKIFSRLYGNSDYTDKKEKDITRRSNLGKILEKIPFYFDKAKYQYLYEDAQKRDELQRYYYIFADYKHNFIDWIIDNQYIINSPNDLTERLIEFAHLPNSESGIDNYRNFNLEKYVLTTEDLLPIILQGLKKAGSTYFDEKEVLINDKILNIPTNSQIFFKKSSFENSNLQEVIDKYNLKENYKIYSVDSKRLNDLQLKLIGDRSKIIMSEFELGKEQLEIKKELVLNDLQKLFFDKSLDKINKILDEKYPSTYYFDWEGEETKYYRWNEVIEVQFLLNKFFEITLREWKSVFRTKRANEIYSMSFYGIYNSIDHFLREFIEQNRDYLENINKYHNENGDYLWLYDIERAVLGVVNTTWDEGNGISDKELTKKYFQMIGGELTSYYKQDEIIMPSIYKEGGETDEPTHFWGNEAGGVLIYCSTTDRYLILLRSDWVTEPNTWGIVSGKLDEDEDEIQQAVYREAEEEIGYKLRNLIPTYIFQKPNFKFHNFVSIVNEEFIPKLNWENTDYKWVKINEIPDNIHFGLKKLLENEDISKLVKKHRMENEILVIDMNMYRYDTSVNFKNKEIPLKLNAPINQVQFIEWAEENDFEFEQWGDAGMDDVSWGYTFEVPLNKYIEYLKTENYYTGGELKKGIKTEMEHKDTIKKIKTGDYTIKESAELIAKDHLEENDKYYTNLLEMEKQFADGGKIENIKSKKGDIKLSLDEYMYSDDTDVELVPVSELVKFREFDRKKKPKYNLDNSRDNINHLKFMFQKEGVKSPLIIEYCPQDNAVLIIEGNHRLNSAIDMEMEYLPARVVLKKYGNYSPEKLKNTMQVSGVKADEFGYIPSNLKPSQVGIEGTMPLIYREGGIIEGRLHSECGDDGCGRKFQVGEGGHIIEAERDEAVIVADTFDDNEKYTIKGTLSQIASALNVMGGGKNFDKGASITKNGEQIDFPEMEQEAKDTDVDDIIDSGSIIINRRSMADKNTYEVTGTPKQIASAINSIDGNGVVIQEGATITKLT